jgi:U3 small nucleolar RNA-associated protein 6
MVPELEAMEARGYFSRGEVRAIVRRRQDFEYALKRLSARKDDYLRCAVLCDNLRGQAGGLTVV